MCCEQIVKYLEKRSFLFFSAVLVVLGIFILGLPYYKIGWVHDDIGILHNIKISSFGDIKRIFTSNLRNWVLTDLEQQTIMHDAFSSWYRPLGMFLMGLLYFLFGDFAFGYFLRSPASPAVRVSRGCAKDEAVYCMRGDGR